MFEELSDIFSDHNNHLTSRELLMKVRCWVAWESMQGHGGLLNFLQSHGKACSDQEGEFLFFILNRRSLRLSIFKVQLLSFTIVQLGWESCAHVCISLTSCSADAKYQPLGGWEALESSFSAKQLPEQQRPNLYLHILYLDLIVPSVSQQYLLKTKWVLTSELKAR